MICYVIVVLISWNGGQKRLILDITYTYRVTVLGIGWGVCVCVYIYVWNSYSVHVFYFNSAYYFFPQPYILSYYSVCSYGSLLSTSTMKKRMTMTLGNALWVALIHRSQFRGKKMISFFFREWCDFEFILERCCLIEL